MLGVRGSGAIVREAQVDPLSEVLSVLKLHSYMASGFDLAGQWSLQFGAYDGVKCYALVSGQCWLLVEGVPEAVRLQTGDCFLLPRGLPFRLTNDLRLHPVDAHTLFRKPVNGGVGTLNGGGGDFFGVGGHFAFIDSHARILLGELPPVVHLRSESDKAELHWCLDRMRQELREQRPGSALVAQQLATTMLVQALRLHLVENADGQPGWLCALMDRQMREAITSMHAEPAYRWTLEKLAQRSGMSRSIFAMKFKATVGTSPMEYLTRWRMLLAGERLTRSRDPIVFIALSLGYESESAFSKAFRRVMASSPRQYRRSHSTQVPASDKRSKVRSRPMIPVAV